MIDKFRVVIFGGRDFMDYGFLKVKLDGLLRVKKLTHKIVILNGGAKGADALGARYAKERGYKVEDFPADWKNIDVPNAIVKSNQYGKYNANAGMLRNQDMADACDVAVGFWDGMSTGTADMIDRVSKKPNRIFEY